MCLWCCLWTGGWVLLQVLPLMYRVTLPLDCFHCTENYNMVTLIPPYLKIHFLSSWTCSPDNWAQFYRLSSFVFHRLCAKSQLLPAAFFYLPDFFVCLVSWQKYSNKPHLAFSERVALLGSLSTPVPILRCYIVSQAPYFLFPGENRTRLWDTGEVAAFPWFWSALFNLGKQNAFVWWNRSSVVAAPSSQKTGAENHCGAGRAALWSAGNVAASCWQLV